MAGQTNIGGIFSIATITATAVPDPQNADLDVSGFAALTYQAIPNMGTHGDTGVDQNIVNYDTWDRLSQKQKGMAIGKDVEVAFLDIAAGVSNGMDAMKLAADIVETDDFAFNILWPDTTVEYYRGVVAAPSYGKGGGEDFKIVTFTIGINQESIFA